MTFGRVSAELVCVAKPTVGSLLPAGWGLLDVGLWQCLQGPSGEGGRLPWPAGGVRHYLG